MIIFFLEILIAVETNIKIYVQVYFTIAVQFYVYVIVKLYIHAFLHLYVGENRYVKKFLQFFWYGYYHSNENSISILICYLRAKREKRRHAVEQ